MRRFTLPIALLLTLPIVVVATNAQDHKPAPDPVIVDFNVTRSLSPAYNGAADNFDSVTADVVMLTYELLNDSGADLHVARAEVLDEVNCKPIMKLQPAPRVAAGESTRMIIEVALMQPGPYSFNVRMRVDDREYAFPVQSTVTAVLHGRDHHCHWWGCHSHHSHDDGHCSTGDGSSWALLGAAAAMLAVVMVRRRV